MVLIIRGQGIEHNKFYFFFNSATQFGWSSWTDYTPCDTNCKKARERYCYHGGNKLSCGGNTNGYGIEKQSVECTQQECYGMLLFSF